VCGVGLGIHKNNVRYVLGAPDESGKFRKDETYWIYLREEDRCDTRVAVTFDKEGRVVTCIGDQVNIDGHNLTRGEYLTLATRPFDDAQRLSQTRSLLVTSSGRIVVYHDSLMKCDRFGLFSDSEAQ
jgi:hypothetical protein